MPGRDDQEAARELLAVRVAHRVDRLPGDQHRHDGRLAGAGRELQREAEQLGVRLLVGAVDVRPELGAAAARSSARPRSARSPSRPPRSGRRTGARRCELMVPPMLQQPRRLGRHLPLVGIRQVPPGFDVAADLVDDRGRVVFLLLGRQAVAGPEDAVRAWPRSAAPLLRLRHRRDQIGPAARLDDPIGRLPVGIQFPMPAGIRVGRIECSGRRGPPKA